MTEQSEKERPTTSITFPSTVGKNASWKELVAHRASMIKKTQALASLKQPNRWLAIRVEASVGRFSDEDTHCIQDETKQLHYKNMGKYVTIIRRRKQNTYSFIYFYITINFSIVPFDIIYQ